MIHKSLKFKFLFFSPSVFHCQSLLQCWRNILSQLLFTLLFQAWNSPNIHCLALSSSIDLESRSKAAGYVNSPGWKKGEPWLHMASYSYKMLWLPMALFLAEALTPLRGWASLVNKYTHIYRWHHLFTAKKNLQQLLGCSLCFYSIIKNISTLMCHFEIKMAHNEEHSGPDNKHYLGNSQIKLCVLMS